MSDLPHWSLFFSHLRRVHLRIHPLFFAVALVALFLCTSPPEQAAAGYGMLSIAVLLVTVLFHEAGHMLVAARVGGTTEQVVVGPLGGLATPEIPREPQAELLVALAGPVVNLALVLATLPILIGLQANAAALLIPWQPVGLLEGAWWVVIAKLFFWCSWVMFLANLLPAYPLDGARVLRALLTPALDYRSTGAVVVRATKLTALGLSILAFVLRDEQAGPLLPVWVPLALLAIFVYGHATAEAAKQDEADWEEELFSYDFSQGYTSLERTMEPPRRQRSAWRQWLDSRRAMRRRKRRTQEQEEERQVDAILIRLHEVGLDGLTAKERSLLHRVSVRYRNRQGS